MLQPVIYETAQQAVGTERAHVPQFKSPFPFAASQ